MSLPAWPAPPAESPPRAPRLLPLPPAPSQALPPPARRSPASAPLPVSRRAAPTPERARSIARQLTQFRPPSRSSTTPRCARPVPHLEAGCVLHHAPPPPSVTAITRSCL